MFKFDKGSNKKEGSGSLPKDTNTFDALLNSLKGASEKAKPVKDLRNLEHREPFYRSLSQEELIKYTLETENIIDLMVCSMSLVIEQKASGKAVNLEGMAKMLFAQAGVRLRTLRRQK
jgi:hypothetical protein